MGAQSFKTFLLEDDQFKRLFDKHLSNNLGKKTWESSSQEFWELYDSFSGDEELNEKEVFKNIANEMLIRRVVKPIAWIELVDLFKEWSSSSLNYPKKTI